MSRARLTALLARAGLSIGLVALLMQFFLTIPVEIEGGRSLAGAIIVFFSFFTILANAALVMTYAAALGWPVGPFRRLVRPRAVSGALLAIGLVAVVYHLLLASLLDLTLSWAIADFLLHTLAPACFLLWWIIQPQHGDLRIGDPFVWALWPLAYAVYLFARASVVGEALYPFLEYRRIGWGPVLQISAGIFIAFMIMGFLVLALDRLLARFAGRMSA